MEKRTLVIIAVPTVILVAVVGFFAIKQYRLNSRITDGTNMENDKNRITKIYYTRGGGMDGGYDRYVVTLDEESGKVSIVGDSLEYYGQEEHHKDVLVDEQILFDIAKIANDNNLRRASHHPESRMHILDAASYTFTIKLKSGKEISISSSQLLRQSEKEAINQILQIIKDAE